MNSSANKDWENISRLRMEFAKKNPELIEKMFLGDPEALELFTNLGGIRATVTSVKKRSTS